MADAPARPAHGSTLESFFDRFRRHIVGVDHRFESPSGTVPLVYADWTASGRLYGPIERRMLEAFGPLVGNTHSEATLTGTTMTRAYQEAKAILKSHVHAGPGDVVITAGSGMTTVVNKLIRILGLRVPEQRADACTLPPDRRPVVFVTHMEHHSNHTAWLETLADVEVMEPDRHGLVNPDSLVRLLERYRDRPLKIGAFTACSNVTGVFTPYRELARIMHEHGGRCFVDFAASAPYVAIDMHPDDAAARLDAVYFSPHKFLGGPGTPGVMVFSADLYHNVVPDQPGGGTVNWTNPWGGHRYIDDIEAREDGGTPGFLQAIKAGLAVRLKEAMGVERMLAREDELRPILFAGLRSVPGIHLLAEQVEHRLTMFSFYVEDLHYSLVVKLLNDRFGVQARGGCSCAGTYGHYLLHVDPTRSRAITDKIDGGDLSDKPGWVRLSVHPTTTNEEAEYLVHAVREVTRHGAAWGRDYRYCSKTNEFIHERGPAGPPVERWFEIGAPETN
jgi:selenocysteine lyase/cysteine desulfurase